MRLGAPSWRAGIRVARRDALRRGSRGRTALIAAMIGLPVAVICGTSVLISTTSISPRESDDANLGLASARIVPVAARPVSQDVYLEEQALPLDLESDAEGSANDADLIAKEQSTWTPERIQAQTGGRLIPWLSGETTVSVTEGSTTANTVETDLRDPIAGSTVRFLDGRAPAKAGEVAVSASLSERGPAVGSTVAVGKDRRPFTVVGVVDAFEVADLYGPPGSFDGLLHDSANGGSTLYPRAYLLDRAQPMTWSEIRQLNQLGLAATSREVVEHPPARSEVQYPTQEDGYYEWQVRATVGIVITAVIIEVTLLAGPAFAVGVRRQRRVLALIGAAGGTPRQVARVVRAQAVVIGLGAALVGAVLGAGGVVGFALVQQAVDPFSVGTVEVVWWQLAATVALGAGAALVAAWFPSRQAARTDVVLELAGRRAPVTRSWGHPVIALVILLAGVLLAWPSRSYSEFWAVRASVATIVLVIGGIVGLPTLLSVVSRLSRRLPLPVRLAARDVDRHRARSTPAAAAIMATVAVLTTLGIAAFSDLAETKATYQPAIATGATRIQGPALGDDAVVAQLRKRTAEVVPGATLSLGGQLSVQDGIMAEVFVPTPACPKPPASLPDDCDQAWQSPEAPPTAPAGNASESSATKKDDAWIGRSSSFGFESSNVGEPDGFLQAGWTLTAEQRAMLDGGGVLVPRADSIGPDGTVAFTVIGSTPTDDGPDEPASKTVRARAAVGPLLVSGNDTTSPGVMLTPRTAEALGLRWEPMRAMLISPPLDHDQGEALGEAAAAVSDHLDVYTERGYTPTEGLFLFLILGGAGGLLVLIGTFTATGLAMADARPDLATLAAVGASPALRRAYSAAQALVIAFLGAALGVALGFVPGLAATIPLTAESAEATPFVDVPWLLLLTLVVGIPVLAALVAAMFTRSKLPLVRRLAQ